MPFTATPGRALQSLTLLLAPEGALSGDGQLRELFLERRTRQDGPTDLWYLPCSAVRELSLNDGSAEAVAALDPAVITWLQLRFGGDCQRVELPSGGLEPWASDLPPVAPLAPMRAMENA
ncbi:hypothetical protein VB716_14175 [Synechococcus sp. CCY9201]|uniref:hypothetical protein n=1 Tax=unclassified Synechococcus TaxID=2626047 RepID=UPI0018CFD44F|nr:MULTISPECIES: hypothetical protein [unclassified Synechococcus]MEA5424292.1 hypothetical protein [Synechococcus sp. CCY9202]MEA5475364.1 hypothetical protein [Synechococcus sp. CCY9201]QPN68117.1 hypothetical protein H8F26_08575 [Synechococcus sp. CBW1006]CAK6690636.1 hypothetical protein IFHNHDMJ_00855 [Synechococcus sp. CBW1107]